MQSRNIAYIDKLDHLRFLAAFTVLMFHANLWYIDRANLRDSIHIPFLDQGYAGVSLFMVISGFILTLITHDKDIDIKRFYINRALRIYPLFVFIVTLGYFSLPDPRETSVGIDYLMALLPISNLYRLKYGAYGGVMFSVAIELQFYLLFPVLLASARRAGVRFYLIMIAFMIMVRGMVYLLNQTAHHLSYFSIFGCLDIFILGCVAGFVYANYKDTRIGWWWSILVFFLINAAIYFVHGKIGLFHFDYARTAPNGVSSSALWIVWPTIQGALWAGLVLTYLMGDFRTPLSRVWSFLGQISYSIYAWHTILCIIIVKHAALFGSPYLTGLLIVLPLTICISALSYYVIEQPFLALRVKYTSTRAPSKQDAGLSTAA